MNVKSGFVVLGGQTIFVNVRAGGSSSWVSLRRDASGTRLTTVEKKLKKVQHAQQKLTSGKDVPI